MAQNRTELIKQLLRELNESGIRDRRVLTAIAMVPRERFVPDYLLNQAWDNRALPIGEDQTISQPLIVAMMTQALRLTGSERILEIGTGSGYQAAVLAELGASVVSVERFESLAEQARETLAKIGYDNVEVVVGDGTQGWPAGAPYDRIIVTAAAPHIPGSLVDQLATVDGARIVIPIGTAREQDLFVYERVGNDLRDINLGPVRFVPLIGQEGWQESDDAR